VVRRQEGREAHRPYEGSVSSPSRDEGRPVGLPSPQVSVVIAAYNERENIESLTRRIAAVFRSLPYAWELLYVIEGTDGTVQIAEGLGREIPAIRILYREKPAGLGNAFRRGFDAIADSTHFVVTMDADLNHQPEEIPRLLESLQNRQADILIGSRFIEGGRVDGTPVWKLLMSSTLNVVMRVLFGLRIKDKTSGFRIYRADRLRALSFENDNFAFLPELLIRAKALGMTIVEEPIHFIFRTQGTSKMHIWTTAVSYLSLLKMVLRRKRKGGSAKAHYRTLDP
jgi:dolichol-phosphate mannosyltransferase